MQAFKKYCLILFVSAALALVSVRASHAQDVQITVELFPEGSSTGNPVTLLLKGKTYPTNAWFDELITTGSASPEEKFVIDAVNINKNGTLTDVKTLWTVDEQNTSLFSDPDVFARSQSFFKRMISATFLAKILYGDYIIFLVQLNIEGYGTTVNEYPLKKQGGRYYLTNKLMKDPVFLYLTEKYSKTLPLKQR